MDATSILGHFASHCLPQDVCLPWLCQLDCTKGFNAEILISAIAALPLAPLPVRISPSPVVAPLFPPLASPPPLQLWK